MGVLLMSKAVIDGNVVVNVIEAEDGFELPGFLLVDLVEPGYIGGTYQNGVFSPPQIVVPTPEEIREAMPKLTPRQLCLMLPSLGLSEAVIEARIAAIADPTDRTYADIEWRRASYFKRTHWLVVQIAEDLGLPAEQMDDLWLMASTL
jgi:hypothetical protein